jgi:hypothetical protein
MRILGSVLVTNISGCGKDPAPDADRDPAPNTDRDPAPDADPALLSGTFKTTTTKNFIL